MKPTRISVLFDVYEHHRGSGTCPYQLLHVHEWLKATNEAAPVMVARKCHN